jgi:hypothetical protein
MERFQVRTRGKPRGRTAVILGIAVLCVGLFELYRLLIPYDSVNPLWTEVTIGQTVLGNWRYGGQDAEGYLKFYNDAYSIVLPPDSHLFAAGGRFVVLEQHSPTSLTYALPWDAIPASWLAAGAALAVVPIGLLLVRLRLRRARLHVGVRRSRGASGAGRRVRAARGHPIGKFSGSRKRRFRMRQPSGLKKVSVLRKASVFRRPSIVRRPPLVRRPTSQRGFRSFGKK